ncbi:MAG: tyrosine-type recombinase/integrase [Alphaproteobacteria bacterium]
MKHLYARGGMFYVRVRIPTKLRAALGNAKRTHFEYRLGTDDSEKAKIAAAPIIANLKAQIRRAKRGAALTVDDMKVAAYSELRRAYESIGDLTSIPGRLQALAAALDRDTEGEPDAPLLPHSKGLGLAAADLLKSLGVDHPSDSQLVIARGVILDRYRVAVAARRADVPLPAAPVSTGEAPNDAGTAFGVLVEEWTAALKSNPKLGRKSVEQRHSAVMRFSKDFPTIDSVTRTAVLTWADKQLEAKTRASVKRMLADVKHYWKFLQRKGRVPESFNRDGDLTPFTKLRLEGGKEEVTRQCFTPEEARRIMVAAARTSKELGDFTRIAAFTGCRREEITSLKAADVNLAERMITIVKGKTTAARRTIPLHPALLPTMTRLVIGAKPDSYVLADLRADKNGDRGVEIGKAFGKLKDKLGFGETHCFHSWRHSIVAQLQAKQQDVNVICAILGHELQAMSYYKHTPPMAILRAAVEMIRYGRHTQPTP